MAFKCRALRKRSCARFFAIASYRRRDARREKHKDGSRRARLRATVGERIEKGLFREVRRGEEGAPPGNRAKILNIGGTSVL